MVGMAKRRLEAVAPALRAGGTAENRHTSHIGSVSGLCVASRLSHAAGR